MEDAEIESPNAGSRNLVRLGHFITGLGVIGFARPVVDILYLHAERLPGLFVLLLVLDLILAGLTFWSGRQIAARAPTAITLASVAGGAVVGGSLVYSVLLGPATVELMFLSKGKPDAMFVSTFGSRFLLAAFEVLFWIYAMVRLAPWSSVRTDSESGKPSTALPFLIVSALTGMMCYGVVVVFLFKSEGRFWWN